MILNVYVVLHKNSLHQAQDKQIKKVQCDTPLASTLLAQTKIHPRGFEAFFDILAAPQISY